MKKTILFLFIITVSILTIGFSVANAKVPQEPISAFAAEAVGTGITYQGYLEDADGPVTDNCDFQFSVFGSDSGTDQFGSTQTHTNVWVENGYFTVQDLNFGSDIFQGDERFLEIAVSCPTGTNSYSTLSPRQPITPAPYALALPGLWTQQKSPSPNLIGGYSGNQVATEVWGATIGGGGSDDWGPNQVTDRYGTIAGGVNNQAGNNLGSIDISDLATVGGGGDNDAHGWASTISGGYSNVITNTSNAATIGGGQNNIISGEWTNTIGGGDSNLASGFWNATVAGGAHNTASESEATVSGGAENTASGVFSTVSGGYQNIASGEGSIVAGGVSNQASGDTSFAAGHNAQAIHNGSFVWADNTGPGMTSTADNQFNVYASGGVNFQTNGAPFMVNGIDIPKSDPEQSITHTITMNGIAQPNYLFADLSTLSITRTVVISGAGGGSQGEKVPGLKDVQEFDLYCKLYCEDIYLWFDSIVSGNLVRRDISINIQDEFGIEIQQWNFIDCWPHSLKPEVSFKGNEIYEKFGIQCDGLSPNFATSSNFASNPHVIYPFEENLIALGLQHQTEGEIYHQVPHRLQISGLTLPGIGGMWVDLPHILIETEIIKFVSGMDDYYSHLPGTLSYSNFEVACIQDCSELHSWYAELISGTLTRRNGSILINDDSNPIEWLLYDCFPASLQTTLNEDRTEVYPTYTMACNTFEIFASPTP